MRKERNYKEINALSIRNRMRRVKSIREKWGKDEGDDTKTKETKVKEQE